MNSMEAKREFLENHFRHSLEELNRYYADYGDFEGLLDLYRTVTEISEAALARVKPTRRLEQEVIADPESGRQIR